MIDQAVDDFLEHYGKKGMKWGVRRSQNRALNKASRAKDKASPPKFEAKSRPPAQFSKQYKSNVDKARENLRSGKTDFEYKKAKFEYKKAKTEIGSREAKKVLRKARSKRNTDYQTASQTRDGAEAAIKVLNSISRELTNNSRNRRR